jgi:hypothetical protein
MLTKAALQYEEEYDRDGQPRDLQDREARVLLQPAFQFENALLQRGMLARLL